MKKILIVTTGHSPFDERIFNKFAHTFANAGFKTTILCSNEELHCEKDGISLTGFNGNNLNKSEKITKLYQFIKKSSPDLIICCEPLPVLAAYRYKINNNRTCSILMDITEWYPEGYVSKLKGVKKYIGYVLQYTFNLVMVNIVDGLIIGELTKKKRYDLIAPFTTKEIIGYYPVLKNFNYNPPNFNGKTITLCYTGIFNEERGFFSFLSLVDEISNDFPGVKFNLKLIGKFISKSDEKTFEQKINKLNKISIDFTNWVPYTEISNELKDVDICFDLRKHNFVFDNSLPIKIFEYMAAGKPVIYTNIKPIRDHLRVEDFGFLVEPGDLNECKNIISKYIENKNLLINHSFNARKLIEEKFNWEKESEKLLAFIKLFLKKE